MDPSDIALHQRKVFGTFFEYEKLKNYDEPLFNLADTVINDYIRKNDINKNEYKNIDIKYLISEYLYNFTNLVNFGTIETKDNKFIEDGTDITNAIREYNNLWKKLTRNITNLLTFNILRKLN